MDYKQTTEYLFSALPSYQNIGGEAYKPGLERIASFCSLLENPQKAYPTVHVAGTNGKGSTSHMLAAILASAGYRVGLFTSPHLQDFRERIRINGEMISEREVVDFVAQNRKNMENIGLSFFEMTAAMAFYHFAQNQVDIAIIETGLGGRLDATNVVFPLLSVITNIGLDHTQYLGTSIEQIAREKAGIIKPRRAVIIGEDCEQSKGVFESVAAENESEYICATQRFRIVEVRADEEHQEIDIENVETETRTKYCLDLQGEYQARNLVCVLAAIEYLNENTRTPLDIPLSAIVAGLGKVSEATGLRGRWQVLAKSPLTVCDTGHNSHGLKEIAIQISKLNRDKIFCVLGFANDKDLHEILALFPKEAKFIFVRPNIDRAFKIEEIALIAKELELDFETFESVAAGFERAKSLAQENDFIYVGGSNFVVADLL